jgi:hypothetical protein
MFCTKSAQKKGKETEIGIFKKLCTPSAIRYMQELSTLNILLHSGFKLISPPTRISQVISSLFQRILCELHPVHDDDRQ